MAEVQGLDTVRSVSAKRESGDSSYQTQRPSFTADPLSQLLFEHLSHGHGLDDVLDDGSGSEDDESGDDEKFVMAKPCIPCSQQNLFPPSEDEVDEDKDEEGQGDPGLEPPEEAPSLTSLLDYNIFGGITTHPQMVTGSGRQAFPPVGGLVAPEEKRKEFVAYLRHSGFLESISRMLLDLWDMNPRPEPEFALEHVAKFFGYKLTIHDDMVENTNISNILRSKIEKLEIENDWMRRELDNFQATETPIEFVDPGEFPPIVLQTD